MTGTGPQFPPCHNARVSSHPSRHLRTPASLYPRHTFMITALTRRLSTTFLAATVLGLLLLGPSTAPAAGEKSLESHPAAKIVNDYLQLILAREWAKSGDLVEPKSLQSLQADFIRRVERAPTMDDEENLLKRVGKSSIDDVKKLDPKAFYTAFHLGLQDQMKVTPEAMAAVKKSLAMKVLSVAEEDATHMHVLVRTKHNNDKGSMTNLELVSLVKVGDAWKVGLNEQMPRFVPKEATPEEPAKPAVK